MYIVLTRDIIDPDTQDVMYDACSIIPVDVVAGLHETLGLDEVVGHLCMTIKVASAVQQRMLATAE